MPASRAAAAYLTSALWRGKPGQGDVHDRDGARGGYLCKCEIESMGITDRANDKKIK